MAGEENARQTHKFLLTKEIHKEDRHNDHSRSEESLPENAGLVFAQRIHKVFACKDLQLLCFGHDQPLMSGRLAVVASRGIVWTTAILLLPTLSQRLQSVVADKHHLSTIGLET